MLNLPADRSRELERSVFGMRMILYRHPANLDNALAVAAHTEVHGIGSAILRQMRTVAGISDIAALPKFLIRRRCALMSRSSAVTREAISQREPSSMLP